MDNDQVYRLVELVMMLGVPYLISHILSSKNHPNLFIIPVALGLLFMAESTVDGYTFVAENAPQITTILTSATIAVSALQYLLTRFTERFTK